jgi:hypothetical protein
MRTRGPPFKADGKGTKKMLKMTDDPNELLKTKGEKNEAAGDAD